MKVGYVAPMSIAAVNGGVRAQALNTIKHIEQFNVEPVLLSAWDKLEDLNLDLIHVFSSSGENSGIISSVKALGIPLVLSPVFFSNRKASSIKSALKIERFGSKFGSGIGSGFGIKADNCQKADLLLPNTTDEAALIEAGFTIPKNKIKVVPNGVNEKFADANPNTFVQKYGIQDFVLFVGQGGAPRKNVIKLLEAAPMIPVPVVIIGSFYEDDYGRKCKMLAGEAGNVHLVATLPHNSNLLASAYAACKVFVLPSQYETPGIAALEAGLAGANIVITEKGGTKNYFNSHATYVNPGSSESIREAILASLKKEKTAHLKQHILQNYTWEQVARQTAECYKALIL